MTTPAARAPQTPLVLKASGPKPPPEPESHEATQPSQTLQAPEEAHEATQPFATLPPEETHGPQGAFNTHGWWAEQEEAAREEQARRQAARDQEAAGDHETNPWRPGRRLPDRSRGAGLVTEQPPERGPAEGPDGKLRCPWGLSAPEYLAYHDEEWGRPVRGDTAIFERLCLEGFQSGLSWLTILRKRENFRAAFAGFDAQAVAAFAEQDVARLMADRGIVRNRAKINAVISNARAALDLPGRPDRTGLEVRGRAGPGAADAGRRARGHAGLQGAQRRAQAARLHVHRPGDRLRDHAGLRYRQRPPGRLFLPGSLAAAAAPRSGLPVSSGCRVHVALATSMRIHSNACCDQSGIRDRWGVKLSLPFVIIYVHIVT